MDVRATGADDFRALAAKFKAAGKDGAAIRKATTATIQSHLRKTVAKIRAKASGMKVKGSRGRGSLRREQFTKARHPKSRRHEHGLRASVARGVKSRVSYTGFKVGARIFVDSSGLPQSQRRLPRYLNARGGWRHPVFKRRTGKGRLVDVWVRQIGEPYFDGPIREDKAALRRDIDATVNAVLRRLR